MVTKERPVLFSGGMARAILDGRKSQTRRVLKNAPYYAREWGFSAFTPPGHISARGSIESGPCEGYVRCPFGVPGDRLWVRETWAWPGEEEVLYRATDQHLQDKCKSDPLYPQWTWRPSIHMPRWASRITLEVTGVRVERLQDISEEDAIAEGVDRTGGTLRYVPSARSAFGDLFASLYGDDAWLSNPWVWAITFKRVQP